MHDDYEFSKISLGVSLKKKSSPVVNGIKSYHIIAMFFLMLYVYGNDR